MGIVLLIKAAAHNSKIKYKGKKKQSAKTKENVGFAISRKRIVGHVGCAEQRNGKLMYQQQALRPKSESIASSSSRRRNPFFPKP
jgi:hypothetical protein